MNVDPSVVEECDSSRRHVQIADDVFVDLPIRFHLANLVGKIVVVHQRLDALAVERCVELVRVAEASKSSFILQHTEKCSRPRVGPTRPLDERLNELVRSKIESQLTDHPLCEDIRCDLGALEPLNEWRRDPLRPDLVAADASR